MSATRLKVGAAAACVIGPLVAAAWLTPPWVPLLQRQVVLGAWGIGATLAAERLLFSGSLRLAARAIGFVRPRVSSLLVAAIASVPMWLFLPALAWSRGLSIALHDDWPWIVLGVVLVNGFAEEVIHRAFVFGHFRREHSYGRAVTMSALVFAAQHLYLIATLGWTAGLASVALAALLAFPLTWMFEHGGRSIGAPAVLHTSSNSPAQIFAASGGFMTESLVPHMGIVLASMYLVFAFRRFVVPDRE